MKFNLQLSHKGIILVSVPLILELVFIAILSVLLHQAEVEVQRQIRSKAIISQANALSKLFYDAGVAMGGYSITKSPLFSDRYDKIVRQIPEDLTELKQLVGDNPHQQQILKNLAVITETGLKILGEAKGAIDDNQVDVAQFRARHMYKEIRSLADRLQEELHGLTEDEQKIANQSPEASNRSRSMVKYYLVVGVIFNVLLAFGLAAFFSREITRRLNVLTDNSMRLARGDPLNPLLGGADEIALLDETFHSMADALTEASRKNTAIIENAVDVICSIDVDGKFIAVSPSSRNTWGFEPEELMGRRFIELVLPADHQETIRAVRAVRAERGTMNFENRTRRKDGGLVTILWSTFWSETERSMFCVAHDISQRKAAEEAIKDNERRIRQIIENMLVGLIIITRDGIIESINPASARMFGYQAEELIGHHIMTVFHDSKLFSVHDATDRNNFMETLLSSSYNRIGELDALKKVGEHFPIEIQLSDLETVDGPKLLANILDVSERKEVERLKKEFVSTVSHELRTPLTSIRGSLTLLSVGAMGVLPEQAKKVVGIAERNTIRLITLINDILDIEKLESGKLDMVFDNLAIGTVLERSSESVKAFAEQNGIKLELIPSNAQVYADGDRLVQVLVNLVSNACKFSPKGETVTVAVEELPNYLEVKVIDRGRGIPAKFKNLLFQRFQQVEASDAKKKGGTGLGLAICKGIIEAHGGTIGVESEEGKGSIFWFRIPPASRGAALLANGPAPAGKTVSANVDEKLGLPALPAPPPPGQVLVASSAPPAMAMAGQNTAPQQMNMQNTQGGYGAQSNMPGQGMQGQGMQGQGMQGQGMSGQGMPGQIAAQSMTGAGSQYPNAQNPSMQGQGMQGQGMQGQGMQGQGMQGQGMHGQQPNFNQNASQGNQTYGGGSQQPPQSAGPQTGSYPSAPTQNPYNAQNPGQANYSQNNTQNPQQQYQTGQAPQGYSYGVPPNGQPNQNVQQQNAYQQAGTGNYAGQQPGANGFPNNGQPGGDAPGNGAPGNAPGQPFANQTGDYTGAPSQQQRSDWTHQLPRPYPQRPPQTPNGSPPAMPGSVQGGPNVPRPGADMNMMSAGGWIPQDQLGQNIQGQPNPFASLSNQPWSNDPNQQTQDGTGARPAAGRAPIPSPINDPANNRPPAKEEKLV
jgi:PAS domain S-box-containing protein